MSNTAPTGTLPGGTTQTTTTTDPNGGSSAITSPAAPSTTQPATTTSQTYVSAPAAGAIAIVALVLGAVGGYVGYKYLEENKRLHGRSSEEEETPKRRAKRKAS
jgi:hypothetical protein